MPNTIDYGGQQLEVSNEVAEFLESDARRQAAEERCDRRHLSKSDFETALSAQRSINLHELEDTVIRNLGLENLRNAVAALSEEEQKLIQLYFAQEFSMEKIGEHFGISKMAISKRLQKLYAKLRIHLS